MRADSWRRTMPAVLTAVVLLCCGLAPTVADAAAAAAASASVPSSACAPTQRSVGPAQLWIPCAADGTVVYLASDHIVVDPWVYRDWIAHLVARRTTVVWLAPSGVFVDFAQTARALDGIAAADAALGFRPTRRVYVGHSGGGATMLNAAARRPADAVVAVDPAFTLPRDGRPDADGLLGDLTQIPAGTPVVLSIGDADWFAGDEGAVVAWRMLGRTRRTWQVLHGTPQAPADHFAPTFAWAQQPNVLATVDALVDGAAGPPPLAAASTSQAIDPPRIAPMPGNAVAYAIFDLYQAFKPGCRFVSVICVAPR